MARDGTAHHSFLIETFHLRWTVPVMAQVHRLTPTARGARAAVLLHRLDVARDALRRTLDDLVESKNWIEHNPGYGHPLRPEYILTAAGAPIAAWCDRVDAHVEHMQIESVAYRKWSMPVLHAIAEAQQESGESNDIGARFSDLRRSLASITPRALTLALKDLIEIELVQRIVLPETYPPSTRYRINVRRPTVRELVAILQDAPQ